MTSALDNEDDEISEVDALRAELRAAHNRIGDLESTLRGVRDQRDRYSNELDRLRTQVAKLRKLSEGLRAAVHVLSDKGEEQ